MKRRRVPAVLATIGVALLVVSTVAAQEKSADNVKTGLRLLVQVSNDFKRQITNKAYTRIPHENMEFGEAADGLRAAINVNDDKPDFKAKVETRLKAAVAAYQKVSDMSATTPDSDQLMAEHAKAVTALNALFDLFPPDLRPDPNTAPGRGKAPAAPPQN